MIHARHRDRLPAAPVSWTGIRPESLLAARTPQATVTAPPNASTTTGGPPSPPATTTTRVADNQAAAARCNTFFPEAVAEAVADRWPSRQTLPWAELLRRVFDHPTNCISRP